MHEPNRVEELYRRYGPLIYARCRRYLKDTFAAEDAAQDVFLKVLEHLERAPDERRLWRWVAAISKNHCLNLLRNERRRQNALPPADERHGELERPFFEKDFAERMLSAAPERLRTPGLLYFADGMQQVAIARALGLSRRTVVSRLGAFVDHARRFARSAEA